MEIGTLDAQFKVDGVSQAFQQLDQQTTGFVSRTNQKFTGQSLFKSLLTGPQSGQAVFAQLEKDANSSLGRISAAFQGATSSFFKGLAGGVGLGGGIFGLIEKAGSGLADLVKGGVSLNQQIERSTVLFTTFTGNAKEAVGHVAELQKLSLQTGVDLPQLLAGSERLQVFGFNLKQTTLLLRAATDQAAVFGNSAGTFDRIVQALGMMAEKGAVATRQITMLERQGVPAMKYLAEATGLPVKKLQELEKAGRLRGDVAAHLIAEGIERRFGGQAATLAQTTGYGLQDATTNALALQAARGTSSIANELKIIYGDAFASLSGEGATAFADNINKFTGGIFSLLNTSIKAIATGDFKGLLEGIGKDALNSLWGGFTSIGGKLFEAGKQAAGFLVGGTKKGLDAQSPSKVMLALGYNAGFSLLTGFDLALQQGTDHVLTRVGETLQQIADRFKVPVETLMQLNPGVVGQLRGQGDDRLPVSMKDLPAGLEINLPTAGSHARGKATRRALDASGSLGDRASNEALLDNPQVLAFLALIRQFEAGGDYASKFGGGEFTGGLNQSTFPFAQARTRVWSPTLGKYVTTSAEGGYQFEPQTWRNVAQANNLSDISARNQDIGAISLLRGRGALPDVMSGDLMGALRKVADEWEIFKVALTQKPELLNKIQTFYNQSGVASLPQTAQAPTPSDPQRDGLLDYYRNLVKQLTDEEAKLNDELGKHSDYFADMSGRARGVDVQFTPQTAKLVDDLNVVRDGLKKAQERLAKLEQEQRELASRAAIPEIPTEWNSVTDFISALNPSGATGGALPDSQLRDMDELLKDIGIAWPEVTTAAKGFTQSMIDLGIGLPPVMQDLSKLNEIAGRTTKTLNVPVDQQKANLDDLVKKSDKVAKEISGVFTSSLDDAFQHIGEGWKATVGTFVKDFALGVLQMIAQAEEAKLAKILFGDEASGKTGIFGKILDAITGGGKGSGQGQSGQRNDAASKDGQQQSDSGGIGGFISSIGSVLNGIFGNIFGDHARNITQSVDTGANKTTDSIFKTGADTKSGLDAIKTTGEQQVAILTAMASAHPSLLSTILSSLINAAGTYLTGVSQSGGSGGGAEVGATGGLFKATPGGRLLHVAEAGHDEVVLTTDPKHRQRTSKLLTQFLNRTGLASKMEAGGWVTPDVKSRADDLAGYLLGTVTPNSTRAGIDRALKVMNSSSTTTINNQRTDNRPVNVTQHIHTKDAGSFRTNSRAIMRDIKRHLTSD
jgi:tape measure domain-containing protein